MYTHSSFALQCHDWYVNRCHSPFSIRFPPFSFFNFFILKFASLSFSVVLFYVSDIIQPSYYWRSFFLLFVHWRVLFRCFFLCSSSYYFLCFFCVFFFLTAGDRRRWQHHSNMEYRNKKRIQHFDDMERAVGEGNGTPMASRRRRHDRLRDGGNDDAPFVFFSPPHRFRKMKAKTEREREEKGKKEKTVFFCWHPIFVLSFLEWFSQLFPFVLSFSFFTSVYFFSIIASF